MHTKKAFSKFVQPSDRLAHATMAIRSALASFDVAFVRHGNTGPAASDLARALTDLGRQQCRSAAEGYVKRLAPIAPLVACSPAGRCVETATIALDEGKLVEGGKAAFLLVTCPSIYDVMMQPNSSSEIWKKLGYSPLRAYREGGQAIIDRLESYADTCLDEIAGVAARNSGSGDGERRTLVVCGHAVYLPSMALALASERQLGQTAIDAILDFNTTEVSGYLIKSDSVELLHAVEEKTA